MGFSEHPQLSEVVEVEKKREPRWIDIVNAHIAAISVFAFNIKSSHDISGVLFPFHTGQIFRKVQFQHLLMPVQAVDIDRSCLAVIYRVR